MPKTLGPPLPCTPTGPGPLLPLLPLSPLSTALAPLGPPCAGVEQLGPPDASTRNGCECWASCWSTWLYSELRRAEYVAKSATTNAAIEISPTARSRRSRRDTQAAPLDDSGSRSV